MLEADELADEPSAKVHAWCEAVGIPFRADALQWEPGLPSHWELWADWHEAVAGSSGFERSPTLAPYLLDDRLEAIAARARPVYEELASVRLRG